MTKFAFILMMYGTTPMVPTAYVVEHTGLTGEECITLLVEKSKKDPYNEAGDPYCTIDTFGEPITLIPVDGGMLYYSGGTYTHQATEQSQ